MNYKIAYSFKYSQSKWIKKLNIGLPDDYAIPLLDIYPEKTII